MKKKNKIEKIEDTSKFGEFIPSCFAWNTLKNQKKKVNELENMQNENKTSDIK